MEISMTVVFINQQIGRLALQFLMPNVAQKLKFIFFSVCEMSDEEKPVAAGNQTEKKFERKLNQQALFLPEDFKSFVVDSTKAFDHIVRTFRQDVQDFRIIAVDTETALHSPEGSQKIIDLLQIGTLNGHVFLFRLVNYV